MEVEYIYSPLQLFDQTTMTDLERENLIRRLKKCLALSASPEPHEAATALRQAQKMMAALNMTEADLSSLEVHETLVKTREGFGRCRAMNMLSSLISEAFGIRCIYERNPGSAGRLNVRYFGPLDRVMLAEYSHRVVWRAMQGSWDVLLTERPWFKGQLGKRQAFQMGWLYGVRSKIEAIAPSESEAAAIDARLVAKYGDNIKSAQIKSKALNAAAFREGAKAAEEFSLHQPVGASPLAISA